jgi:hypothetical protein
MSEVPFKFYQFIQVFMDSSPERSVMNDCGKQSWPIATSESKRCECRAITSITFGRNLLCTLQLHGMRYLAGTTERDLH